MEGLTLITAVNHWVLLERISLSLLKKKIKMLSTSLGRSVLEKTVPSVLSAVLKTSGTVFPTRTFRLANTYVYKYIYCFLTRNWLDQMTTTNRIILSQALIIIRSKRNTFIIRN